MNSLPSLSSDRMTESLVHSSSWLNHSAHIAVLWCAQAQINWLLMTWRLSAHSSCRLCFWSKKCLKQVNLTKCWYFIDWFCLLRQGPFYICQVAGLNLLLLLLNLKIVTILPEILLLAKLILTLGGVILFGNFRVLVIVWSIKRRCFFNRYRCILILFIGIL
jgi:hypothetical protein